MAKTTITFSIDVEATGPIPGPWWMCSFGICRTDDLSVAFQRELKPLENPTSQPETEAAMRIVSAGLEGITWDPDAPPEENIARVRQHFVDRGTPPRQALEELRTWLSEVTGENRAVIIGSPVTFDFMWIYWYWWHLLEEMPLFGFSGLDIRSYFMGSHGVDFLGTGKKRYLKHYPNTFPHTHDPLDDARQQAQIWHDMTQARLRKRS